MTETGEICRKLADHDLLRPGTLILVEHRRGNSPQMDERFQPEQARNYGDTEITFVRYKGNEDEK